MSSIQLLGNNNALQWTEGVEKTYLVIHTWPVPTPKWSGAHRMILLTKKLK